MRSLLGRVDEVGYRAMKQRLDRWLLDQASSDPVMRKWEGTFVVTDTDERTKIEWMLEGDRAFEVGKVLNPLPPIVGIAMRSHL